MSDFWIKLLALITAAASMLAQFEARWYPPQADPPTATQSAEPQWIDACGTFHYYSMPAAAETPWYCAPPDGPHSTPVPPVEIPPQAYP